MEKQRNPTATRILALVISFAALLLVAAQPPPSITGKWEQASGTLLGSIGSLWEFFGDGTLTIGGYAGNYSWPDSTHLKIELGMGMAFVYQIRSSADEFTLTDPNSQTTTTFRRYQELALDANAIAGTWQGGYPDIHCFTGLGLEYPPVQLTFTEDGSFAIQDDSIFSKTLMLGHFVINANRVHITASGTITSGGFLGGRQEKQIGGDAECEATISNARLVFKNANGEATTYTRSALAQAAATQFPRPTNTPTPTATPVVSDAKIVYVPISIQVNKSEFRPGWSDVIIRMAAENRGGKPYQGEWPRSGTVTVAEGFTYPVEIGGLAPGGGLAKEYNFGLTPILAPGFRILAPPYITSIADTTHLKSLIFDQGDAISLESTSGEPNFPTSFSYSQFAALPDTIEKPGVARLTIDSFEPPTAFQFLNPGWGNVPGDAAFMNVSFQNLNIGQDQELPIKLIAFFDGYGVVKPWDSTVVFDGNVCQAGNTGLGFIGLVDTHWPFIAGPGQSRTSQLCIRLGKEEGSYLLAPRLSTDNLKVLIWVDDETWRIYDVIFAGNDGAPAFPVETATPVAITATPVMTPDPSRAQQIAFAVRNGTFTSLHIEGLNQRGEWSRWDGNFNTPQTIALTQDYWWQGTVVLTFDVTGVGKRMCVLDYLQEVPGSTMAAVVYTEGQGCTGEGGSAEKAGLFAGLAEYTSTDDAYKILDAAQFAVDAHACVEGIILALETEGGATVITVLPCAGASLYIINGILEKYDKQVTDH